jgi:phospholipid/cholesterol/gamma-HCH transport system permease protein
VPRCWWNCWDRPAEQSAEQTDCSLSAADRALLKPSIAHSMISAYRRKRRKKRRYPVAGAHRPRRGRRLAGHLQLLGFIGLILETFARSIFRPKRWRVTPMVAHIEQTGLDAAPIVALLTFLVGAVVAFLGATVLKSFGATILPWTWWRFPSCGIRRLLTAILMAGRTASAFTAQIGSMKANEEIDAIRTLGLDPMELLVVPRAGAAGVAADADLPGDALGDRRRRGGVRADAGYLAGDVSLAAAIGHRRAALSWWAWSKRRSSPS